MAGMKQFSLLRLFASVAMIAVGLAALFAVLRTHDLEQWVAIPLWISGGALVGAGLFAPFHKTMLGAIVGLSIQIVLLAMLYSRFSAINGV
jgi:hypothetical protein